jgi:NAD(P)-dependent dehydrogenase (short-subunit alcohol dehydrogenase family)
VHYYQADVRDENALGAVIRKIGERFDGCDGVIHGAGVIDDKLIGDKTPESFDYVFGTKLDSALNLSRLLDPERLKFCAFFASVAGRFGNRGQSDYAAANEVLAKLATYLDQRWPGRVVSIVWGPWSRIGMVSELEGHLSRRGLQLIPPEIGPLRFCEELQYGRKGECEVVIAGEVGQLGRPHHRPTKDIVRGEGLGARGEGQYVESYDAG